MKISRHCATCKSWDDRNVDNTLKGFCPQKGVTFLVDGCEDWEQDAKIEPVCETCGQKLH